MPLNSPLDTIPHCRLILHQPSCSHSTHEQDLGIRPLITAACVQQALQGQVALIADQGLQADTPHDACSGSCTCTSRVLALVAFAFAPALCILSKFTVSRHVLIGFVVCRPWWCNDKPGRSMHDQTDEQQTYTAWKVAVICMCASSGSPGEVCIYLLPRFYDDGRHLARCNALVLHSQLLG